MKRYVWLLAALSFLMSFISCEQIQSTADPNYDDNATIEWRIREVMQYDPININGIDLVNEFDFFKSFSFKLYRTDGKFSALEFNNGDIPFMPFGFAVPSGKVECYLSTDVSPYELRLKDSDKVVAYFKNGEFYIPFQLDCIELSYQYKFGEVK